jgi:predicted ATP-grasp superfamily ATP-dependent carboligase
MERDEIRAMADDYQAWVRQTVEALRAGVIVTPEGFDLVPGLTNELHRTVEELSPDAARFALVTALVALSGTDF